MHMLFGKLVERQGRKAVGLRGAGAYDRQVALFGGVPSSIDLRRSFFICNCSDLFRKDGTNATAIVVYVVSEKYIACDQL